VNARAAALGLFAVCVVLGAGDALACPSCVDPTSASNFALLRSTIVLSLVPLAFIAAVVRYVVVSERRAAQDEHIAAESKAIDDLR